MSPIASVLITFAITMLGFRLLGVLAPKGPQQINEATNQMFPAARSSSVAGRRGRCYLTGLRVAECDCVEHGTGQP